MTVSPRHRTPALVALASLALAALHLSYEHFTVGVQSHHLLNRADLPAISNWLGLIVLPLLGWLLGVRLRNVPDTAPRAGLWTGFVAALLYGLALAVAFELDATAVTPVLFLGLFLLGIVLPVYRAEFVLGFVVGMTFTFGPVLPTLVATVVAGVSVVVRLVLWKAGSAVRRLVRPSGVQ